MTVERGWKHDIFDAVSEEKFFIETERDVAFQDSNMDIMKVAWEQYNMLGLKADFFSPSTKLMQDLSADDPPVVLGGIDYIWYASDLQDYDFHYDIGVHEPQIVSVDIVWANIEYALDR